MQCKVEKPPEQFHSKGRGARDCLCKICRCALERAEYEKGLSPAHRERLLRFRASAKLSPEEKRERQRGWSRELVRARAQRILDMKRGKPCMDCGGVFHPHSMDFDHRDPASKTKNVSQLVYGSAVFNAEIAKCDLVCANCHRVRTARRRAGLPATLPEPEFFI